MTTNLPLTRHLTAGILLGVLALITSARASAANPDPVLPPKNQALRGDSVQMVLWRLAHTNPGKVGYIQETGRYFLFDPRGEAVSEELLTKLQDAFYYDISETCKYYGYKYLADWRTLAAKSSRETFWGTSFLCNRAHNYFGIIRKNKPWACESFRFCTDVIKNDPDPTEFMAFNDFESSLWMFIHTIYSPHYLERMPDGGARVAEAIAYERRYGVHYWQSAYYSSIFSYQLPGPSYTHEELIYTWSEHAINNLCVNCSRKTDKEWVNKVWMAEQRAKG